MFLPVINKTPLFSSNADFNQISSAWAKCGYWQAILAFEDPKDTHYWGGSILTFFLRPTILANHACFQSVIINALFSFTYYSLFCIFNSSKNRFSVLRKSLENPVG